MYTIQDLNVRLLSELKEIAEKLGLENYKKLPKKELIYKILDSFFEVEVYVCLGA